MNSHYLNYCHPVVGGPTYSNMSSDAQCSSHSFARVSCWWFINVCAFESGGGCSAHWRSIYVLFAVRTHYTERTTWARLSVHTPEVTESMSMIYVRHNMDVCTCSRALIFWVERSVNCALENRKNPNPFGRIYMLVGRTRGLSTMFAHQHSCAAACV